MRVLFCGSGEFAVPTLRLIARGRHELVRIITQPARPAGRGGKLRPTPVSHAAGELGLPVLELADINSEEGLAAIQPCQADAICVVDFGQFVRRAVRACAAIDSINLHGSLLPALRGAAPVRWAIIRGLEHTGVTTFSLVDKMDAGGVYLQAETDILPDDTAVELSWRLAQIGADLVCRTLDLLESGQARPIPQEESLATLAPKLQKGDGRIDWSQDAPAIRNRVHGAWPWPGGHTVFRRQDGKQFDVVIARAVAQAVAEGAPAGDVGRLDADLCALAGAGRLRIVEIQPAGKRLMMWKDFVNGYRVAPGDRFLGSE